MEPTGIGRVRKFLENKEQSIGIILHTNPDGDAIGSALGLLNYLQGLQHTNVQVIAPNHYASFLHWMPGNEQVLVAEDHREKASEFIASANLLFCLDFNELSRAEQLGADMEKSSAKKIMIDHHPDPGPGFDLVFSDTGASSTAEMLYEFITALSGEKVLNLHMAECLYAGMITDTGSLSYNCNNPRTYEIIACLMRQGVDGARIHRLIYNTYSADRMRLLGYCLSEKLRVIHEAHTAYISLSSEDLARFHHREGDTEGVVNYALAIENIRLAALFTEKEDHVKVSFRSTGDTDVNRLARQYYHGGGHKNAAGGKSFESLKKTLEGFETLIKSQAVSHGQ